MTRSNRAHTGFTLIELLVVIAIIAILAGILFPVFAKARDRARTAACLSNGRQIGMAVRMYVDDWSDTWPVFQAYNTQQPHLGVEVALLAYSKDKNIFRCPNDSGGPALSGTGFDTYHAAFGSSYRFTKGCFSVVNGLSRENDALLDMPTRIVKDGAFIGPSNTRIIRDEMMPWPTRKLTHRAITSMKAGTAPGIRRARRSSSPTGMRSSCRAGSVSTNSSCRPME